MELTLVAVVFPITATHRLLKFTLTAQGTHAFSREAVWGLDTGAAIAADHVSAGVLQSCRQKPHENRSQSNSTGVPPQQKVHLSAAALRDIQCYCTQECIMHDRPAFLSGCSGTLGGSAQLFWVWRTTWHPRERPHSHSCLLQQASCVSFCSLAQIDFQTLHSQHILFALLKHALIATAAERPSECLPFHKWEWGEGEARGGEGHFSP